VVAPKRNAREETDFVEQVGYGVLVLVTFASLRATVWHSSHILFRLIDLASAPEPLLIAERLHRASDPRWSVSVLLVTLPVFLAGFWVFTAHFRSNSSVARGKFLILVLAALLLDSLVILVSTTSVFLFTLMSDTPTLPNLLKIVTTATVYGALLAYLVGEMRRAAWS
jgi:hypothetical protein